MDEKIVCTEQEEEIFNLIRRRARELGNVTPRVAGGWVRDKIMGVPSLDMDIALENITGYRFAASLEQSATDERLTSIHVIRNNPEKSKHLETVVMRINGMCIDFVNLRSEAYADTRIPEMTPGTPEEDALRRDLTINSLFYNLFTNEIEDFTGQGVIDIRNKTLMTPTDPKKTLLDDPLRLVRIFRFHSKLGFSIHDRVYEALQSSEIREALVKKVSNERIHIEILKIIHYPRGQYGLVEIIRRDCVDPIFKPPVEVRASHEDALVFCEAVEKVTNIWGRPYRREILNLYTILCFFARTTVPCKKGILFSNVHIMRSMLPSPKSFVKTIERIERSLVLLEASNMRSLERRDLVHMIRYMGETWYESFVIYSAELCMRKRMDRYADALAVLYDIFLQNISECHLAKPVVDTRNLASVLEIPQEDLGVYIEESVAHQISCNTADPAEIIHHLKQFKATRNRRPG